MRVQKKGAGAFCNHVIDDLSIDPVKVYAPAGLPMGSMLRAITQAEATAAGTTVDVLVPVDADDLPEAILYAETPVHPAAQDFVKALAVVRVATVTGGELAWPAGQTAAQKKAAIAALKNNHVVVR